MTRRRNWAQSCIVFVVSAMHAYFPIKEARVNRIYRSCTKQSSHPNQSKHFKTRSFERQKPWRTSSAGAAKLVSKNSRLSRLDKYVNFYWRFSLTFNLYLIAKNVVVIALDLDIFRDYRYLDCYLVGRFLFNGRVVDMANHFVCFMCLFHIIWSYLMNLSKREINMPLIEFMLHDHESVLHWQKCNFNSERSFAEVPEVFLDKLETKQSDARFGATKSDCDVYYSAIFCYSLESHASSGPLHEQRRSVGHLSGAPSSVFGPDPQLEIFRLRPNRTLQCWKALARLCIALCLFYLVVCILAHSLFWWMAVPLLFEKRGFELTHANCISWIVMQLNWARLTTTAATTTTTGGNVTLNMLVDHRKIVNPPPIVDLYVKPQRFRSAFTDLEHEFVEFNYYHVARILVNIMENIVIYIEIELCFVCKTVVLLLMVLDVLKYSQSINLRLLKLIDKQRDFSRLRNRAHGTRSSQLAASSGGQVDHFKMAQHAGPLCYVWSRQTEQTIQADTLDIQTMIADLFKLIGCYNKFASLQIVYLLAFWLSYSALVSGWIFIPNDSLPKAEWYCIHLFATLLVFFLFYPMSLVRSSCKTMYNLSSIAMALDNDISRSKGTWSSLLRFYSPIPLHCFTVLTRVELSLMFAFKMLFWLLSALIVASGFFSMSKV